MNKKILLGFFCFFISQMSFAVTIDDLGYKSIFRTFYPDMFHASMENDEYEGHDLPKAGIKEFGKVYLAMMYPPEEYKNANGETRYLVYIKKREIGKQEYQLVDGKLRKIDLNIYDFSETCHACDSARAELFIFKMDNKGTFDLIAKSNTKFIPPSTYGDNYLDIKNLKNRIVKTGSGEVGFFDDSFGYTNRGITDTLLYLVRLNENQIKGYSIDLSAGSNLGEYGGDSPLSYEYSSEFITVSENELLKDYPIQLKFKGDAYIEKTKKIEKYNKIKIFKYNVTKDSYELSSEVNY
ncbi:hypothetical protein ACG9X6_15280 [Acinetobacter guillouiae]|uniref:hypothetical protein n=1 Tax=Acinetobacter guillouiae TaxID=106649 RepID=UPI003AF8B7B9